MNDMKRTSDCCPSCCVKSPSPCTADCSLQRTPARKRVAPAPAARPPSIGYVNVKHGTFHTLAQLAATERNGDLIASGEIVEVCPVLRGALAAPVAPGVNEPTAPHILEALSYHECERDDLTLEDAVEALRHGYKKVYQRDDRAMLAQIIHLLAAAPLPQKAAPSADSAADVQDAARYRWLKANVLGGCLGFPSRWMDTDTSTWDAEIDAMRCITKKEE